MPRLFIPQSATFHRNSLEVAFRLFCQEVADSMPADGPDKRSACFRNESIEWIDNEGFHAADAESRILGRVLFPDEGTHQPAVTRYQRTKLPSHLSKLCEAELLSPDREVQLFQKMNYLRFLAHTFQVQQAGRRRDTSLSFWEFTRIEALLRAANRYRDIIVESNIRLVISIVKKFVNANHAFDDLLSDGIMALMRAIDKFDFDRGFRFSTYATQVVRRNTYRTILNRQKERLHFSTSLQEAGLDICDRESQSTYSIDRWNELQSRLVGLLDLLDRREKLIVRARFSLGGHERVQTLQCLADELGVSKERVRQLESRALQKLRSMASRCELSGIEV